MKNITFINNKYVDHKNAKISVEDRGMLFADSIYELISVFNKNIIDLEPHLDRLKSSLKKIKINYKFNKNNFKKIFNKLIKVNKIENGYIYIQITRGVAERKHEFPNKYTPTTIIFTKHLNINKKVYEKGVKVITIPDLRWLRRDIKSTSLLPNILSKQIAIEKKAFESWLIDNGKITEVLMSVRFHKMGLTQKEYIKIESERHTTDAGDRSGQNESQKFASSYRAGRKHAVECFNFLKNEKLNYDGIMQLERVEGADDFLNLSSISGLKDGI